MDHPIVRFTNELMRVTDDLKQATAADFASRVYNADRDTWRAEQHRAVTRPRCP